MEGDEAGGIFYARGMQQHPLDHAEDGGIRTDAQGQGQDGDDGEERGVKKTKQGLPEISQKHAHLSTYSPVLREGGKRGSQELQFFPLSVTRFRGYGSHLCTSGCC